MMLICLFYPCLKKERGVIETNMSHFFGKAQLLERIWHLEVYLCF